MADTAIITGASSGIGLELANVFAREGYDLLITARRKERLKQIKSELEHKYGSAVHMLPLDLATSNAPVAIFDFVKNHNMHVTVLVNNAGVGDYGFFHESEWQRQTNMLELNIKSLTHLTHLFLPVFVRNKKGYLLNIASTAAFQPGPLMSVYYASKHYVLAFGEALANELNGTGVTVTTLCPGPTESEFQEIANMQKSKLFDRFPVATSMEIAEYGYKSMKKGKRVALYGIHNKILPKIVGIFPRSFITAAVRKIQERKD